MSRITFPFEQILKGLGCLLKKVGDVTATGSHCSYRDKGFTQWYKELKVMTCNNYKSIYLAFLPKILCDNPFYKCDF